MVKDIHVIRGVAHWAKILGAPRKNNFDDGREWTIDVTPDKEGRTLLRKLGIADRLREPKEGDSREESYISFRHRELMADGSPAEPIRVVDAAGDAWDDSRLIGNGSVVDVKFKVKDYGKGKKKGVYIRAVRVLELVPYASQEFAPLSSDDEYFAAGADEGEVARLPDGLEPELADDLDDDVPE